MFTGDRGSAVAEMAVAFEHFVATRHDVGGLISHDDIEYAAEALEPDSSAALLIWEVTWAKPLVAPESLYGER